MKNLVFCLSVLAVVAWASSVTATVVFDDFNDNTIDPTKWTTKTAIPQGGATVIEQNQRMELANRGYLVSKRQFDPTLHPDSSLSVSGEWTFAQNPDTDFMQILLRSDGVIDPGNCCGETQNGIEFFVSVGNSGGNHQLDIRPRGSLLSIGSEVKSGTIQVFAGDVFNFSIFDDGTNLSYVMTEVGDPSNTASVTASVTADSLNQDFVVFHNRERAGGNTRVAYLDDALIAHVVPEPSTLLIWSLLAGLGVGLRWRRRK